MITSLVEEPQSTEVLDITPRCCHTESRVAAYNLLVVLCDECVFNLQSVVDQLVAMHHSERVKTAKEWEVSWFTKQREVYNNNYIVVCSFFHLLLVGHLVALLASRMPEQHAT